MAAFQERDENVPVWWPLRCMRQSPVFDLSEVRQMTAGENVRVAPAGPWPRWNPSLPY